MPLINTRSSFLMRFGLARCIVALLVQGIAGQHGTGKGEWTTYGGDLASTRHAPLDQIDASNFNKLERAWGFKTDNLGPQPEFYFQSTPLMVNGVLYSTAGTRRSVVALDPATGELLWTFSLNEGERGRQAPRRLSGRGHGFVFVFDRITGKPVWPIEERPVPKGDVPGGW